jgi:hypothetical protein
VLMGHMPDSVLPTPMGVRISLAKAASGGETHRLIPAVQLSATVAVVALSLIGVGIRKRCPSRVTAKRTKELVVCVSKSGWGTSTWSVPFLLNATAIIIRSAP